MLEAPECPKGYRFPKAVISSAVYLYHRFLLSYRDVQELLFKRGINISHETVCAWCARFGPDLAEAFAGYYLYRYDASGYEVASYAIGNADTNSPSVDQIAVDNSGNVYAAVAERPTDWGGKTLNFVAKYSPTGTLLW